MDDSTPGRRSAHFLRTRRHPLAGAVLLAVLGSALAGCASSGPVQGDAAVQRAQSAYARKEYRKAAELLSVPAMQGNAEAQYALGYLYYYGRGVRKDQRRARAWFEDAARLGHPGAQRALRLLTVYAQMPPLPGEDAPAKQAGDGRDAADPAPESASVEAPAGMGSVTAGEPMPASANVLPAAAPVTSGQAVPAPEATAPAEVTAAPVVPTEAMSPAAQPDADTTAPAAPASPVTAPAPVVPSSPAPAPRALHSAQAPVEAAPVTMKASWRESPAPAPQRVSLAATPASVEDAASPAARPRYTVHLLSSRSRADLERLVQAHGLVDANYYAVDRADGRHYRLIYGGFETVAEARRALDALPRALHAHGAWVNNYPADVVVTGFEAL
ncbi:MAG: SPOR domain-containing protein [Thiohalomonadaceae bacterium]